MRKTKYISTYVTRCPEYGDYMFWGKVRPHLETEQPMFHWGRSIRTWFGGKVGTKNRNCRNESCDTEVHSALGYSNKKGGRSLIPMSRATRMVVKLTILVTTEAP